MLNQIVLKVKDWLEERQEGQGLVEYALIILLISVVVIVVLVILGGEVSNIFYKIVDVFQAYPGS